MKGSSYKYLRIPKNDSSDGRAHTCVSQLIHKGLSGSIAGDKGNFCPESLHVITYYLNAESLTRNEAMSSQFCQVFGNCCVQVPNTTNNKVGTVISQSRRLGLWWLNLEPG